MAKQILSGSEARTKIFKGVETLSNAVTTTLGPKGRNVGLMYKWVAPKALHDGVSVAREIELEDQFENYGAQMVKEAASKTNDRAGDGTTTSTLLAYEITRLGMEALKDGINPMIMKEGMDAAVKEAVKHIKKVSRPVNKLEEMKQVATISAADENIGSIVAEAVHKVGKDGVVSVDLGATAEIEMEIKEGMQFDRGYISPHFITNVEEMTAEIVNPYILVCDYEINSAVDLFVLLEKLTKEAKREDIVIIAPDVTQTALYNLVINKQRGGLKPLAVKAPFIADRQKQVLEDIAVITGASLVSKDKGMKLEEVGLEVLGRAEKVISDASSTQIVGGYGKSEDIQVRIDQIKKQIEKTKSEFEKTQLKERLSKLSSGAAIISVGAISEVEMGDKIERVKDAVEATKAAAEEGVVQGAGLVLLDLSFSMDQRFKDKDVQRGYDIVKHAFRSPFKKLLENAGADEKILDHVAEMRKNNPEYGWNIVTGEPTLSMFSAGILDPAKVTRNAVENSTSVAGMILTTEVVVVDIPETTLQHPV